MKYEVGTVQLYRSPLLPSGMGHPSPQRCNRKVVLGSRVGLLAVPALLGTGPGVDRRSTDGAEVGFVQELDWCCGGTPRECTHRFGNVSSGREVLCLKFSCLSHFQLNWTNILDLYWQHNLSCVLSLQSSIVQPHLRKHG